MARNRKQIDLGGPLLREQEGCELTKRSLSGRLAEIADRLALVTRSAMPALTDDEWSLVCWVGWDAVQAARITQEPCDVDTITWSDIFAEIAPRDADLALRLRNLPPVQRVSVLERIEAYGRAQAMERG